MCSIHGRHRGFDHTAILYTCQVYYTEMILKHKHITGPLRLLSLFMCISCYCKFPLNPEYVRDKNNKCAIGRGWG